MTFGGLIARVQRATAIFADSRREVWWWRGVATAHRSAGLDAVTPCAQPATGKAKKHPVAVRAPWGKSRPARNVVRRFKSGLPRPSGMSDPLATIMSRSIKAMEKL